MDEANFLTEWFLLEWRYTINAKQSLSRAEFRHLLPSSPKTQESRRTTCTGNGTSSKSQYQQPVFDNPILLSIAALPQASSVNSSSLFFLPSCLLRNGHYVAPILARCPNYTRAAFRKPSFARDIQCENIHRRGRVVENADRGTDMYPNPAAESAGPGWTEGWSQSSVQRDVMLRERACLWPHFPFASSFRSGSGNLGGRGRGRVRRIVTSKSNL